MIIIPIDESHLTKYKEILISLIVTRQKARKQDVVEKDKLPEHKKLQYMLSRYST